MEEEEEIVTVEEATLLVQAIMARKVMVTVMVLSAPGKNQRFMVTANRIVKYFTFVNLMAELILSVARSGPVSTTISEYVTGISRYCTCASVGTAY